MASLLIYNNLHGGLVGCDRYADRIQRSRNLLGKAYATRAVAGVGTIGVTTVSTVAIVMLKGDAWVNWLLAQPFRVPTVKDADKNAFNGKAEDLINATVSVARNTLGQAGTPADSGKASKATAPKPASTHLYAVPESQVMKTNTKTPFRNEAEMMDKLADALEELQ